MRVQSALILVLAAAMVVSAVPTFKQSFSVTEDDDIDIHQGGYEFKNGLACCPKDAAACKIQVENEGGINYQDATKKMQAFQALGTSQILVSDYNTKKQYDVVDGKCRAYCPLQDDEFPTFGINANATSVAPKKINGVTCNGYFWKTTLFGVITMQTSTFYVDESDPSNPIPCAEYDNLTPFGEDIGTEASTWQKWNPTPPPASVFEFANKESCEESNKCNSNTQLARYLRFKQYKTYLYHSRGLKL